MKFIVQFASVVLVTASVSAQTGGGVPQVRRVRVAGSSDDVEIEVVLNAPAQARMVSTRPHELVVEIPGAVPGAQVEMLTPRQKGLKSIRVELHRTKPPATWVVVALEQMRPYGLAQDRNTIILHLLPVVNGARRGQEPAAAAQASVLWGGWAAASRKGLWQTRMRHHLRS